MSARAFLYDVTLAKNGDKDSPFGISFTVWDGTSSIVVKNVLPNVKILSISEEAGNILAGDRLVGIDNVDVLGRSTQDILVSLNSAPEYLQLRMKRFISPPKQTGLPSEIVIHLRQADGNVLDLVVHESEDPVTAIRSFLRKHNLPEQLVPALLKQVHEAWSAEELDTNPRRGVNDTSDSDEDSYAKQLKEYTYRSLRSLKNPLDSPLSSSKLRSRSMSFSSLPTLNSARSPRLKNQAFYDRMHGEGQQRVERREKMRELFMKDFTKQLEWSSFRVSQRSRSAPPTSRKTAATGNVYQDSLRWVEKSRVEREAQKQKNEEKKKQDANIRSSDPIKAPTELDPKQKALYDSLYHWKDYFDRRAKQRQSIQDEVIKKQTTFSPSLSASTRKILQHKKDRKEMMLSRVSSMVNQELISIPTLRLPSERYDSPELKPLLQRHEIDPSHYLTPNVGLNTSFPEVKEEGKAAVETNNDTTTVEQNSQPKSSNSKRKKGSGSRPPPTLPEIPLNVDVIETIRNTNIPEEMKSMKDENYWKQYLLSEMKSPTRTISNLSYDFLDYSTMGNQDTFDELELEMTVFDRLYQDRWQKDQLHQSLRQSHLQQIASHQPDIGINKTYPIEKDKDAFFQRLYSHAEKQKQQTVMRKIEQQRKITMECSKGSRTLQEAHQTVERLLMRDTKRMIEAEEKKSQREQQWKQARKQTFMSPKSKAFVEKAQRQSLEEIFNVLLVSTYQSKSEKEKEEQQQLQQQLLQPQPPPPQQPHQQIATTTATTATTITSDMTIDSNTNNNEINIAIPVASVVSMEPVPDESHPTRLSNKAASLPPPPPPPPPPSKTHSKKIQPTEEVVPVTSDRFLLQLALACPGYLQPLELARGITHVLAYCIEVLQLKYLSKEEFITHTLALVDQGKIPPISYLLTPLTKYQQRIQRQELHLSSEELEIQREVYDRPKLTAAKMTNSYTSYRDRSMRIEDNLRSYLSINESRLQQLRDEVAEEEALHCTFTPTLISEYHRQELEDRKQRRLFTSTSISTSSPGASLPLSSPRQTPYMWK